MPFRKDAKQDHSIRKFFLLHPNQYHFLPSEALSKVPHMDSRKVYFSPVLKHVVACKEGECEYESGVHAPEFDCVGELESGGVRDVVLINDSCGPDAQLLQAEAALFSVPLSGLPDSSLSRRRSRRQILKISHPLLVDGNIASGLTHPPVGFSYFTSFFPTPPRTSFFK